MTDALEQAKVLRGERKHLETPFCRQFKQALEGPHNMEILTCYRHGGIQELSVTLPDGQFGAWVYDDSLVGELGPVIGNFIACTGRGFPPFTALFHYNGKKISIEVTTNA
jgi:hypothetical protein